MTFNLAAPFGPTAGPGGRRMNGPTIYFDDFTTGVSQAGNTFAQGADTADWDTLIDAGGTEFTIADASPNGVITGISDDVATDINFAQLNGQSFSVQNGRELYFEIRIKVSTVTGQLAFGVNGAAALTATGAITTDLVDGVIFETDASGNISLYTARNNTASAAATFTRVDTGLDLAADTWDVYAFHILPSGIIRGYVGGALAATINEPSKLPNDVGLSPMFGVTSSTTVLETVSVDYILVTNERKEGA